VAISPDSAHLHAAWARIQRNRHRYPEALESAMKAFAASPSPEAMRLLGSVFEAWGQVGAAVAHYKAAERMPPKVNSRETFALIEGYKRIFSTAVAERKLAPDDIAEAIENVN
jgi:tetratricopeptide (TPR) repeat protein